MVKKGSISIEPHEAKFNAQTLDKIDAHFLSLIEENLISGASYTLSRSGKIFAHRAMGKEKNIHGTIVDITTETIRPIFSITKLFTATAIIALLQEGKLNLEQEVRTLITEFDNDTHKTIDITHLLTHTSGLYGDDGQNFEPYPYNKFDRIWSSKEWIREILRGPMAAQPGSRWIYCTAGYQILAEIVARASGKDYDSYVMDTIIKPLELDDTFFFLPEEKKEKVAFVSDWSIDDAKTAREAYVSPSLLGGGGLYSSLKDLQRFASMWLHEGRLGQTSIIGKKLAQCAMRAQAKDMESVSWKPDMFGPLYTRSHGLGWEVERHPFMSPGSISHEGFQGAGLFIDREEEIIFTGFYMSEEFLDKSWVNPLLMAWSGIE